MHLRAITSLLFLGVLAALAQSPPTTPPSKLPQPGAVRITLLADKPEFFLGENILLHYRVENTGKEHLDCSVGGDYRGGTRANRFKVTVVDAAGRAMPDPAPKQWEMGGLSPVGVVKPGAEWFENVWLLRYRTLEQPGDYMVTVFHDLGWGEPRPNDPRQVTIKLRIKSPSVAEARQVINDMEQAKSNHGTTWGKKGQPTADFSLLKFPVYRPLLAARGDRDAIAGLAEEPTLEATRILLRLVEAPDSNVSCAAAIALSRRIPAGGGTNLMDRVLLPHQLGGGREPVTNAWDAALAPEARRAGLKLVARATDAALVCGAAMVVGIATQEDLPALIAGVAAAAERAHGTSPTAKDRHEGPRWACRDTATLLGQMSRRGINMPPAPKTAGDFLAFLSAFGATAGFHLQGWEQTFVAAMEHPHGVVREAAVARVPQPLPVAIAARLIACMTDPEPAVRSIRLREGKQLEAFGGGRASTEGHCHLR